MYICVPLFTSSSSRSLPPVPHCSSISGSPLPPSPFANFLKAPCLWCYLTFTLQTEEICSHSYLHIMWDNGCWCCRWLIHLLLRTLKKNPFLYTWALYVDLSFFLSYLLNIRRFPSTIIGGCDSSSLRSAAARMIWCLLSILWKHLLDGPWQIWRMCHCHLSFILT